MTTENALAVVDAAALNALANEVGAGADDLQGNNYLPSLKVNYMEEDEAGRELKKGLFFLSNMDTTVYAKTVVIRPLMQLYQWTQYDEKERKTLNRTRFIRNFSEEARDEKGTVRCGKPTSRELKDNPKLAERYEDIKCYRHIYALVSYKGTDIDGVEHEVKDVLATLRLKGANFINFQTDYIDKMPKGSNIWDYEAILTVTKEKNDPTSAASYYVIHYDIDNKTKLPFTNAIMDTVRAIKATVDDINRTIDRKYEAAHQASRDADDDDIAINALDITPSRSLADDFAVDDIPF